MLSAQLITATNRQIEMELLGYRRVWPHRSQQAVDLLEGETPSTVQREKYQPVRPPQVGLSRTRGLIPGPVLVSKQLSVELPVPGHQSCPARSNRAKEALSAHRETTL